MLNLKAFDWEEFCQLLLITIIISLAFHPASAQPAQWKGKIEIKEGIKIIKNPAEPAFGEFIFDLKEDLSIGGDPTQENYYIARGGWFSVDNEGNIYVCDTGNRRVHKYDSSGKYIMTIGRVGQGPGEYQFPSQVFLDSQGNLCVSSARELVYFTSQGNFIKKVNLKASLSYFILGPKGTIIGIQQPRLDNPVVTLVQLNAEGDILRTIAEFPNIGSERKDLIIWHWYSPQVALASQFPDHFWYGYSLEYKLYLADAEGRTKLIVTKDEKPTSISAKEKEVTKEKGVSMMLGKLPEKGQKAPVAFPPHRPFFSLRFLNDEAGRLYVYKLKSILDESKKIEFDIFSGDGFYLYKTYFNFNPWVIKNGYVYEIRTHEETGEIKIIRHLVKNWSQLRS